MEISKDIVLKALTAGKKFKFVESDKEVEAYYNQKIYAIKKDSIILKELILEKKFPVDNRILNLQKGYYYIVDIYQKEREFKSQTQKENIAYALFREKSSGDFFSQIYQVRLKPLTNYISERLFGADANIFDLIGKTICVFSFGLDKEKHSYKVSWEGVDEIEMYIEEVEIEKDELQEKVMYEDYLIDQEMQIAAEEEAMLESMYVEQLIEEEMLQAALEEAEEVASMTEYIEATEEDITFENVEPKEENGK